MDPMPKASLEEMLSTIPQQSLSLTVSDKKLDEIARALVNWRSVCTNLGITEAEEETIKEENQRTDDRRYLYFRPSMHLLIQSAHFCTRCAAN